MCMCEWAAIWHNGKKSPSDISTKHNVTLPVFQAQFMKFKIKWHSCDNSKLYFQNQSTVHAFRLFINGSRTSTHSLFSKLCAPPSQNNVTCLNSHNPHVSEHLSARIHTFFICLVTMRNGTETELSMLSIYIQKCGKYQINFA